MQRRSRLWLLTSTVLERGAMEANLAANDYRLVRLRNLPARSTLQLVLAAPG